MWLFIWYLFQIVMLLCYWYIHWYILTGEAYTLVSLRAALLSVVPSCLKHCRLLTSCQKVHKHQKGKTKMVMNYRGLQSFLWCSF